MVTKMATTFFEFQFDIAIPRGAPQHSAASNGGGHVGAMWGSIPWESNSVGIAIF